MTVTLIKILILFGILNISLAIGLTTTTSTTSATSTATTTTTTSTTTTVNVTFPHNGIQNDMEMSEEQFKALTGDIDFDSYDYLEFSHSFYPRDDLFKWSNGIIPYEFDTSKPFEQDYQERIKNAIEKINSNLIGCVLFR